VDRIAGTTTTVVVSTSVGSTTPASSSTTTGVTPADVEDWLHSELTSFVAELEETGMLVGPSVTYSEPRCMRAALEAVLPPGTEHDLTTGAMRFFLEDRTARVDPVRPRPEDDKNRPDWKPTEWAVAIVLTFRDETWVDLPREDRADEVIRVEAASFRVEPVREPKECTVMERYEITERVDHLLPQAFTTGPTG
jgi:hypothetical protein